MPCWSRHLRAVRVGRCVVHPPLPRTYAGDPALLPSAAGYRSFYAGHSANAFAAATFAAMTLRLRHKEMYWPWLVAALAGSFGRDRESAGRSALPSRCHRGCDRGFGSWHFRAVAACAGLAFAKYVLHHPHLGARWSRDGRAITPRLRANVVHHHRWTLPRHCVKAPSFKASQRLASVFSRASAPSAGTPRARCSSPSK